MRWSHLHGDMQEQYGTQGAELLPPEILEEG